MLTNPLLDIIIKSPISVPKKEIKVYTKHQIRKLELNIVNVTISQMPKLISKITNIFLKISCITTDIIRTNNGYVNMTIPIGSLSYILSMLIISV